MKIVLKMKGLLVLALAVVVQSKPQYSYNRPEVAQPSGSYGGPLGGSGRLGFSTGLNSHTNNNLGLSAGVGQLSGGGFGANVGLSQSGSFGISGHGSVDGLGGGNFGGGNLGSGSTGLGGGQLSGGGGYPSGPAHGGAAPGGGQVLVQKHIYFHVAPPEPEEQRTAQAIASAPAQKHYKIIFIKAPTPQVSPAAVAYAAQQKSEEKTLIYVLVKKPESVEDFARVAAPAPTPPSKPEVYFIRYKANKQAVGGAPSGVIANSAGGSAVSSGGSAVSAPTTNYGPPGQSGPY